MNSHASPCRSAEGRDTMNKLQRYPKVNELAIVHARQIAEMGVYVKLVSSLAVYIEDGHWIFRCIV